MTETIELAEAMKQLRNSSTGAHLGKVMKEGGVLMQNGVATYYTPAPRWVFECMARGIQVDMGAWCRKATAAHAELLEELQAKHVPEGQANHAGA